MLLRIVYLLYMKTYVTRAESGCILLTVGLGLYVNISSSFTVLLLIYRLRGRVVESFTGKAKDWNVYMWRLPVLQKCFVLIFKKCFNTK